MNEYTLENDKVIFDCGCEFFVEDKKVNFIPDLHNPKHTINFDCKLTYKNLSEGLTEGIFQLTTPLGNTWCKKVQPECLEHLSALGSILRPGSMNAKDSKGISTTIHYERRKNSKEEITPYHPIIDEILKDTYGCMIYQEQSMEITVKCAGFTLQEADSLRKAIGKKIPEEMAKSKKLFLEKANTFGVLTDEQSVEVFNWIEASQRYSFNHSHAMSYGITGYVGAYIKTHFPIQFYKSWLQNEKKEKYPGFINEAKLFDVTINPPDIRHFRHSFYNINKNIYFGLSSIKGIVKKDVDKLVEIVTEKGWHPELLGSSISWIIFLREALDNISSKTVEGLIHSGALDCFKMDRALMWYEYQKYHSLTKVEKRQYSRESSVVELVETCARYYQEKYKDAISDYEIKLINRETSTRKRSKEPEPLEKPEPNQRLAKVQETLDTLKKPLYNIQDTLDSIIYHEENLLGTAITRHASDAIKNCVQTHNCIDIAEGCKEYAVLRVKIDQANRWLCKAGNSAGKAMCFIRVSDSSSMLGNVVCFPSQYEEFQHLLTKDNLVFISGQSGKDNSFVINKVYPIS